MKLYKINSIFSCLLFFTIVGCKETKTQEKTSRVDALPYYAEATFTPNWLDGDDENLKSFHTIPSFNLTNQLGETVSEKTFENKIYVADFFFTTCSGICPKMTANMKVLQDEFLDDDEILLLSHSVTPETDSVPTLKQYAENKGIINSKWHLVTGDRKQIYDLGRQSYFAEDDLGLDKTDEDFLHTENFVLIDQNRHIRGIYNGLNKTAVQQLIADVKTLQRKID